MAREAIWCARSLQSLEIVLEGDGIDLRTTKGLDPLGVILEDIRKEAANFHKIELNDVRRTGNCVGHHLIRDASFV